MVIEHKWIRLRALEKKDLPLLARWWRDWEVGRFLDEYLPLPQAEFERRFETMLEAQRNQRELHYGIEDEQGKLIGAVGLGRVDWKNRNAELYIAIGEKNRWDQGYGTEAITGLLEFAFRTLNLHRIWLPALALNQRAIRCYEKCGFQHEGRAREALFQEGRYHDVLVMGILQEEFTGGV